MFTKTITRLIVALALVAAVPVFAAQGVTRVRLATLAPDNSPWTNALRQMGAMWQKATGDRVRLIVNAGTVPDSTAISRMAAGGQEAATLFVAGLGEIDPAFNVFGIPFFFESDAELEYVQAQLEPMLMQKLAAKKLHLLNWGNGGWVRLFSKMPLKTLAEIKAAKLYTTEGDPKTEQWYKQNGFNIQPLATSAIPFNLKNPLGLINAAPSPPVYALATGFFNDAKYMLDLKLGPFAAATVITEKAWSAISADDRTKMMEAATAMEKQVNAAAPGLDTKYIEEMKKAGLTVVALDAKAVADFKAAAGQLSMTQRGSLVPAEAFDAAIKARDAFRKGAR
jgi:TRAP-type C4-dicarboxylate transport system substrate-binding protein